MYVLKYVYMQVPDPHRERRPWRSSLVAAYTAAPEVGRYICIDVKLRRGEGVVFLSRRAVDARWSVYPAA